MLNTSKKFAIVALLGAGLVMGKTASATTITQTFTIPTNAPPFTTPFTFALFDTTLGTLNTVTIFLATNATAEVDIFNTTGTPQAFTNATASLPVFTNGPAGVTVNYNLTAGPFAGTANPGANAFPGVTGSTSASTNVPAFDFGSYEGAGGGSGALSAGATNGTFSGSAGAGVFFGGSATVGGTVSVIYNYTSSSSATPEPGTWGLMVAGASTGLVMVRRRRRK